MRTTHGRRRLVAMVVFALVAVSAPAQGAVDGESGNGAGSADSGLSDTLQRRNIEADELGVGSPTGLLVDPGSGAVYTIDADGGSAVGAFGDVAEIGLDDLRDPLNTTIDATGTLVITLIEGALVAIPLDGSEAYVLHPDAGVVEPRGVTVDRDTGDVYILDNDGPRIVVITLAGERRIVDLDIDGVTLRGIAHNHRDGLFYVGNPTDRVVYAFDGFGRLVETFDISDIGLTDAQAIAFAPSSDPTDDPDVETLVIADAGDQAGSAGQLVEVALDPPLPAVTPAQLSSHNVATLVNTFELSQLDPPSPDSAGVTYIAHRNNLLVSDSEVNEMAIFENVNLYEMSLGASLTRTGVTLPWSNEPTGVSYNSDNQHLLSSTDSGNGSVYDVTPGADGTYGTGDDTVVSFGFSFDVDAEGVSYDPVTGNMWVADGTGAELWEVDPGPDGLFNGVGDSVLGSIDVGSFGAGDPEGVGYNHFDDTLLVVDNPSDTVYEVTKTGQLVRAIDVSAANGTRIAGVVLAPASDGSSNWHLYIADRRVDNGANPNENDGALYELSLDFVEADTPPVANDDTAETARVTPVIIDVAANDTDADGNLDPTTAATTTGPASGGTVDNGDGTITYTPNAGFSGEDTFDYEICDLTALCDTATVTVNVNDPPVADAGPDQTVEDVDTSGDEDVTLDGTGSSDIDGTIVSYEWSIDASPLASGSNPTVTLGVGVHTIDLLVTDDDGATDTDQVIITVEGIFPPDADAGPDQTVGDTDNTGDEDVTLDGSGTTPGDGTIVSYEWFEGVTSIATGETPTVTFGVGVHTIDLVVTDDNTLEGTDQVIITVDPAVPPTRVTTRPSSTATRTAARMSPWTGPARPRATARSPLMSGSWAAIRWRQAPTRRSACRSACTRST